jgi:alkanesulfonate monooxygenase SsuD/methylene tetrahydromethanopterin reductase-like flavin-dependent oxidoreductase (luciferase family)
MLGKMPLLECWTTLSALSRTTKKIRLGTMVTCNSFRNPALLAKMASNLDNLSNGRLEFGIGAGIQKEELRAYGFKFHSLKTRIEILNEALEVIKKLWTEDKVSYRGKHYSIIGAHCEPKPVQNPHPPIVIGGSGEKHMLRVTARHADRYDWGYVPSLENYKHKLRILEKHCKVIGRNFDKIEKSRWLAGQIFIGEEKELKEKIKRKWRPKGTNLVDFMRSNFVGTPEDCIKELRQYLDLGITQFMLFFGDLPNMNGLRLFAKKVIQKIK